MVTMVKETLVWFAACGVASLCAVALGWLSLECVYYVSVAPEPSVYSAPRPVPEGEWAFRGVRVTHQLRSPHPYR